MGGREENGKREGEKKKEKNTDSFLAARLICDSLVDSKKRKMTSERRV